MRAGHLFVKCGLVACFIGLGQDAPVELSSSQTPPEIVITIFAVSAPLCTGADIELQCCKFFFSSLVVIESNDFQMCILINFVEILRLLKK